MYSGNIDLDTYEDPVPHVNSVLAEYGLYLLLENGHKGIEWSVLKKKPFSEQLNEFNTWEVYLTGKNVSVWNCITDAAIALKEQEHDSDLERRIILKTMFE